LQNRFNLCLMKIKTSLVKSVVHMLIKTIKDLIYCGIGIFTFLATAAKTLKYTSYPFITISSCRIPFYKKLNDFS